MGRHVAPRRDHPRGSGADDEVRTGPPRSVEGALRSVRTIAALLVAVRLLTAASLPWPVALGIAAGFLGVNLVSLIAERNGGRVRAALGVVQLLADALLALAVLWVRQDDPSSADWVILVLPVLEGAIRFRVPGAVVSGVVVAGSYFAWNAFDDGTAELSDVAQHVLVVFLVALPVGILSAHLAKEIADHRARRDEAEHRGALLRAAALGGRRSTSLDVDEILTVLRETVGQMGFADTTVFEVEGHAGTPSLVARPVRHSSDVLAIPPGDARLTAGALARDRGSAVVWPPPDAAAPAAYSVLVGVPVSVTTDTAVVLTARWPEPGAPPDPQCESIELFASQAGAALRNAQVHTELQGLKDRLAHEAAHDSLTDLPNRRRFHEDLERVCGRGRASDLVAVLFLDLDGFKEVNDRYGHDQGNALLVAVAKRIRNCVRPGDIVARMGGDEFTVMLTRLQNPAPAIEVAERICTMLTEPFELGPDVVRVSTSIGIALSPADRADSGDLVRRADVAMYRAKSQGKAGWAIDPGSLGSGAAGQVTPSADPGPAP